MSLPTRLHHLLLCIAMISTAPASAGISLDSTRIIFDAKNNKSGVNIQVNSAQASETPYLVKAQVTQDMSGNEGNVPFITTPSLFRLDPGNSNQVRILIKPHAFPEDRESIFYFRTVAIPTQAQNEDGNISRVGGDLQLASGNIIKLFYRPAGLTILPERSADQLIFSSVQNGIKVSNPTPYFVTLTSLNINGHEVNLRTTAGSNMIPPKSETVYSTAHRQGKVQWQVINDYGGMEKFNGIVQ